MAFLQPLPLKWSRLPDLNWAPTVYDTVALPDELRRLVNLNLPKPTGAVSRNRTGDLFLTMEMLYQLS